MDLIDIEQLSSRKGEEYDKEVEKHKRRAERFGTSFKEPNLNVMKEAPVTKRYENVNGGVVTGFDLFSPEEIEKRELRKKRFGIMEGDQDKEKGGKSSKVAEISLDDMAKSMNQQNGNKNRKKIHRLREPRKDFDTSVERRDDALHMYGTDRMSTGDIFSYFSGYDPSYVEWIDDSSCNVIFADVNTAKRAYFILTAPIDEDSELKYLARKPWTSKTTATPPTAGTENKIQEDSEMVEEAPEKKEDGPNNQDEEGKTTESGDNEPEKMEADDDGDINEEGDNDNNDNRENMEKNETETQTEEPITKTEDLYTPKELLTEYGWRVGVEFKSMMLLIRYATVEDKKPLPTARKYFHPKNDPNSKNRWRGKNNNYQKNNFNNNNNNDDNDNDSGRNNNYNNRNKNKEKKKKDLTPEAAEKILSQIQERVKNRGRKRSGLAMDEDEDGE